MVNYIIESPHGVNPKDFFEGNRDVAACLGHHFNICRQLFGLKIQKCASVKDKLVTQWTHPMVKLSFGYPRIGLIVLGMKCPKFLQQQLTFIIQRENWHQI